MNKIFIKVFCFLLLFSCFNKENNNIKFKKQTKYEVGYYMPDVYLYDKNNQKINLEKYKGRVVLLNFWATFCPPCLSEMPSLVNLQKKYNASKLIIIGASVDNTWEAIDKVLKNKYSFTILLDKDKKFSRLLGVYKYPETFIIDKNGLIVDRIIGANDWDNKIIIDYLNKITNGEYVAKK
jgi:thiol-disulfide isomerase/thioredoxin